MNTNKIKIKAEIDCPSCARGIEKTLGRSVSDIQINVPLKLIKVEFDPSIISSEEIVEKINKLGYKASLI